MADLDDNPVSVGSNPQFQFANNRGVYWLLNNVDSILAQATQHENAHEHQASGYDVQVAQVRATEAVAVAITELIRAVHDLTATQPTA